MVSWSTLVLRKASSIALRRTQVTHLLSTWLPSRSRPKIFAEKKKAKPKSAPAPTKLKVQCASEHNLKDVSLELQHNTMSVFCGPSGSGKSSLAMDTIYAEGQRRYVESLSSYARQFVGQMPKPKVDRIEGLAPAIAIEQKTVAHNPRSTVGTVTEIYDYLRVLMARLATPHCPIATIPSRHKPLTTSPITCLRFPKARGSCWLRRCIGNRPLTQITFGKTCERLVFSAFELTARCIRSMKFRDCHPQQVMTSKRSSIASRFRSQSQSYRGQR